MNRALVTGASGYVGGKLVARLLALGWTVHVVVRPETDADLVPSGCVSHFYRGEYREILEAVEASRPDVVFHIAAQVLVQHRPEQIAALLQANIALPVQLAEAMAACGVRNLVNAGTSWQRADGGGYSPVNLYAASKQAAEDLLRHFHRNRGLSCVTLELFDIYGIDDTRRKLLSLIRDTVREGGCLDMTAGEQVMDLTHVEDVVEAFLLSARWLLAEESPLFERRSVCGERLRVRDLVGLIERSNGGRPVARLGVLPYRERELMLPPAPLAPVPGWSLCRGIQADFVELLFPRGDRART